MRADLEPKFGADFSGVRLHTDAKAAQLSQDVGAQAFTQGRDIYFNQGKYNPNSGSGKHLLAHELTHTVQQGGNGVSRKVIQRVGEEQEPKAPKQQVNLADSLGKAAQAYTLAEANALYLESLAVGFQEDFEILQRVDLGENRAGIKQELLDLVAKQQVNKQNKKEAKQLKDNAGMAAAQEAIESNKDKRYYLTEQKKYRDLFETPEALAEEQKVSGNWVMDATTMSDHAYQKLGVIYVLYRQIKEKHEKFHRSGKGQKEEKQQARVVSAQWAEEAAAYAKVIEGDGLILRDRKIELQKQNRMASGFMEDPLKWIPQRAPKMVLGTVADFGAGLASAGLISVKQDTDKRGFLKPMRVTNVVGEVKEEFAKIKAERSLLQGFNVRNAPERFFDLLVSILQGADRIVLTALKRILGFLKIYCSVLSSVPFAGPAFTVVGTVLGVVRGLLNMLSTAINGLIVLIRGAQAYVADPLVANVLKASAMTGGINGATSGIKSLTFALTDGINVLSGTEQPSSAQSMAKQGTTLAMPLVKAGLQEGGRMVSPAYKNMPAQFAGERLGADEYKAGMRQKVNQTALVFGAISQKMPDAEGNLSQTQQNLDEKVTGQLEAGLNQIPVNEVDPTEQATIETTQESNSGLQAGSGSMKLMKEVLGQ